MPKILIIDDDPQHRSLLSKILSAKNFEVSTAKDGIQGLDRARSYRPDLIILDIIMPELDGFSVAQRIREDPVCRKTPIMVLTAFATTSAQQKCLDAGVNAFLTKPLDYEGILATINDLIDSSDLSSDVMTPADDLCQARMISVHSLSGGLGCTSLAINLAFALKEMWHLPTLLLDGNFAGDQIAVNLKQAGGTSWSDLLRAHSQHVISQILDDPAISLDAELHLLAGPRNPTDVDHFSARVVSQSLQQVRSRYEYIVADPAHDFRESTLELLRSSDKILYLLESDSVSLQSTRTALTAYAALGFRPSDVELVLVDTRPKNSSKVSDVESIIGRPLLAHIPYSVKLHVAAERGLPLYKAHPTHPISKLSKDLAFLLSKQSHRNTARRASRPAQAKPRPQPVPAAQNGAQRGVADNLLRRMGLAS